MLRLLILLLFLFLRGMPALAQGGTGGAGTIPNGFPQDAPTNVDGNASVILVNPPAAGTYPNYRILSPTARFVVTDNGASGTYQLELATVPVAYGGTGATTAQVALNNLAGTSVKGDMLYYDGANWVHLTAGSGGQELHIDNVTGLPAWSTEGTVVNAAAKFYLGASDATMPNATVLSAGTGIAALTYNAGGTTTVGVDSTVLTNTSTNTGVTNKTFTTPGFTYNGVTLQGTAHNVTMQWQDWVLADSGKTVTIPALGGNSQNFVLDDITQTLNGVYTFTNAPKLGTNTITSSTGLTITFPNSTDTLVNLASVQTLSSKTLTNPQINGGFLTLDQTTANYQVNFNNPGTAGTRNYYVTDVGTSADFVMLNHNDAYTANGIFYANGSTAKITAAGSAGQPLLGGSPPSFGDLGVAHGGTGLTTYGASFPAVMYASAATTTAVLAPGSPNQVLSMNGAGTGLTWVTAGTGTVTSVGLSMPSQFAVSGSPVTGAGTLTAAWNNQSAYTVFGNNTNGSAAPGFQTLVNQQLPNLLGGTTAGSIRAIPTTGTLTGEYWQVGDWTTTGLITCNRCRLHVLGNVTISNAITVNTEAPGGKPGVGGYSMGAPGGGIGGGGAGVSSYNGSAFVYAGGGGGGNGGSGGNGGAGNSAHPSATAGGAAYNIENQLCGSGGGGPSGADSGASGVAGAAGGGALLIECSGNVTIGANISATGATPSSGGSTEYGGGGSGGTVYITSGGNVTINAGVTVDLSGGAGGSPGTSAFYAGGGGGGGRFFARCAGTYTNSGTITVSGGAAGSPSVVAASAGSSGVVDAAGSTPWSVRTAP